MNYFYIIKRNGTIFEMPYSTDGYKAAIEEHVRGGIIIAKPVGYIQPQSINAKDIVEIVDEQGYETYIHSAKPRLYLKAGVWRDGKEHREVRIEPWLAKKREETKQLAAAKAAEDNKPLTPEQIAKNKKRIRAIGKAVFGDRYKPSK